MNTVDYKPFDIDSLSTKENTVVSTECALTNVIPIEWDDEVVSGLTKVVLIAGDS